MAYKVFIDGMAGTTGLKLAGRLKGRQDIELVEIGEAQRKDQGARLSCMDAADITFLCLPDESAAEIAKAAPTGCRIIDCSTAHRTAPGWIYGMPELFCTDDWREKAVRVSNPGCHATGFILSIRPLVDAGIVDKDAVLCVHSLTGYSGGGKAMIAEYEGKYGKGNPKTSAAPRQYALQQNHKHIPEMKEYSGLKNAPLFSPVVCGFYCGMLVSVALPRSTLRRPASKSEVRETLEGFYEGSKLVKVRPPDAESSDDNERGFLSADGFAGRDDLEIFVTGKDDMIEVITRYDNLGKGASGAAIQNMNIMLGLPEESGLMIGE